MSEKTREMLEKFISLPEPVQDKFLDMAQGASMAMGVLASAGAADQKGDAAGGSSGVEQRGSA